MAVEEDDLVRLAAVDLIGMAQADHVLGELALGDVPHPGLAHEKRLEPFPAQAAQHLAGRDVGVTR